MGRVSIYVRRVTETFMDINDAREGVFKVYRRDTILLIRLAQKLQLSTQAKLLKRGTVSCRSLVN